jgi:hypothetical protein
MNKMNEEKNIIDRVESIIDEIYKRKEDHRRNG